MIISIENKINPSENVIDFTERWQRKHNPHNLEFETVYKLVDKSKSASIYQNWYFEWRRSCQENRRQNELRKQRHDSHFLAFLRKMLDEGKDAEAHFLFDIRDMAFGFRDINDADWQAIRQHCCFDYWTETGEVKL